MRTVAIKTILLSAVLFLPSPMALGQDSEGLFDFLGKTLKEIDKTIQETIEQNEPPNTSPPARVEPGPATAPPGPQISRSETAEVQRRLNALGYDAGPVDGAYGRATAVAIEQFQRDAGLKVTGRISRSLLDRLREAQTATAGGAGSSPRNGQTPTLPSSAGALAPFDYSRTQGNPSCGRIQAVKDKIFARAVEWGEVIAANQYRCGAGGRSMLEVQLNQVRGGKGLGGLGAKLGMEASDYNNKLSGIARSSYEANKAKYEGRCQNRNPDFFSAILKQWRAELEREIAGLGPVSLCTDASATASAAATTRLGGTPNVSGTAAAVPTAPPPAAADWKSQLRGVAWFRQWRLDLLWMAGQVDKFTPASPEILKRTLYQIGREQARWEEIAKSEGKRTRFVTLEWQAMERTSPQLASGPLLDLFVNPQADWSFFKRLPGYEPAYRTEAERLLASRRRTEPEAFLFAKEAVSGRVPKFVVNELAPVYLRHLKLAVTRVPKRMKLQVPVMLGPYDFERQAFPIARGRRQGGRGEFVDDGLILEPVAQADSRLVYDLSEIARRRSQSTKPSRIPGPTAQWRGSFDSRGSLALDVDLVLKPLSMPRDRAEQFIRSLGERGALRFRAHVVVDIRGPATESRVFHADLVHVYIEDHRGNLFASYGPQDFEPAQKRAAEMEAKAAALAAEKEAAREHKRNPFRKLQEQAARRRQEENTLSGPVKERDIVGLKIGMPLEQAESKIREVLGGAPKVYFTKPMAKFLREKSYSWMSPYPKQNQHLLHYGKLYATPDLTQQIALYVDPTTADRRIIGIGRIIAFPDKAPSPDTLHAALVEKYGNPQTDTPEWFQRIEGDKIWCTINKTVRPVRYAGEHWIDENGKSLSTFDRPEETSKVPIVGIEKFAGNPRSNYDRCADLLASQTGPNYLLVWLLNPRAGLAAIRSIEKAVEAQKEKAKPAANIKL